MPSFPPAVSPARRRTVRALSGVAGAAVALLVWLVAVPVADAELTFVDINDKTQEIGPAAIIIFSVGAGLAGWALLAVLERLTPRWALRTWTVIAVIVLVLSMAPLLSMGARAAVALGIIHLVVGACVIAAMRLTAPRRPQAAPALAEARGG